MENQITIGISEFKMLKANQKELQKLKRVKPSKYKKSTNFETNKYAHFCFNLVGYQLYFKDKELDKWEGFLYDNDYYKILKGTSIVRCEMKKDWELRNNHMRVK